MKRHILAVFPSKRANTASAERLGSAPRFKSMTVAESVTVTGWPNVCIADNWPSIMDCICAAVNIADVAATGSTDSCNVADDDVLSSDPPCIGLAGLGAGTSGFTGP